jgi:hypothetical protein
VAGQPNLAGGVVRKDRCDTPILGTGQLRLLITLVIGPGASADMLHPAREHWLWP